MHSSVKRLPGYGSHGHVCFSLSLDSALPKGTDSISTDPDMCQLFQKRVLTKQTFVGDLLNNPLQSIFAYHSGGTIDYYYLHRLI